MPAVLITKLSLGRAAANAMSTIARCPPMSSGLRTIADHASQHPFTDLVSR